MLLLCILSAWISLITRLSFVLQLALKQKRRKQMVQQFEQEITNLPSDYDCMLFETTKCSLEIKTETWIHFFLTIHSIFNAVPWGVM